MIVSLDGKRYFHNHRGLGNYSREVVRLLTSYYPENIYYLFNPAKKHSSYMAPDNVTSIYPDSFFYSKLPSLWRSGGCLKQIVSLQSDIYHGLSQELPLGIHKTRVKNVVTIHDAIFVRYPELYDPLYRKIFMKKNRYSVKVADRIIAVSEQTKRDFIDFFNADPAKIDVVYQGCNSIFREAISGEQKALIREKYSLPSSFLLYVGAVEKRKNLETIIRALYVGKIDTPLVVVGNKTPYLEEMIRLIDKLKMQQKFFFLHNLPTADLPALYASASIFIYPSVFEGFGIPILEALCAGSPVITSRGSCFEETGGDAARYVGYDNPEEMACAIGEVLSDNSLRQSMVERGRIHADRFTDEKIAENLFSVYKQLI